MCVKEKIETGFVAVLKDRKWQVAKARQEKVIRAMVKLLYFVKRDSEEIGDYVCCDNNQRNCRGKLTGPHYYSTHQAVLTRSVIYKTLSFII